MQMPPVVSYIPRRPWRDEHPADWSRPLLAHLLSAGWSLRKLAVATHVDVSQLSRWSRGLRRPDPTTIRRFRRWARPLACRGEQARGPAPAEPAGESTR